MYKIETNKECKQVGIYSALHGLMYIWKFNIDLISANIFLENVCKLDNNEDNNLFI
jgi:hypothetical protein